MKKADKKTSTILRLQQLQRKKISTAVFFSGLFVLVLLVFGFCYVNDSSFTGNYNPFTVWGDVSRQLYFVPSKISWLPTLTYAITNAQGVVREIDATGWIIALLIGMVILGLLNGLTGLILRAGAKKQIYEQLRPLFELAKTAQTLSEKADPRIFQDSDYYDLHIHNLESAIESVKPDAPDAGVYTGDADLKSLEDAINSLLKRTRDSYSQQIRFVSDASHELRTPIAVMKGYADMLDRWGKKDEKILDESIAAIKGETDHMNRLVEQLLFLARGDSGRTKLVIQSFSLSQMVKEVYDESVMVDSTHRWNYQTQGEIVAVGDVSMLKQAVRILVDNAAKYTPEGETISLRAAADENGAPVIVIQDNGIGISEQDMSHIFDRFFRSDEARNRQQGGTGLGLAIAKWIVDRHDGYFDILSRQGLGTRISVHLPAKNTMPAEVTEKQ